MTLKFIEVPPEKVGGGSESPWRAELRAHPGKWAEVKVLKAGRRWAGIAKMAGFEVTQRSVDGLIHVYARYIGNGTHP